MNKQELLNKLTSSEELIKTAFVPVSEVINWVNELEESNVDLSDLADVLVDDIVGEAMSLIEDYDLEMSYREVELSSIDINERRLKEVIRMAIESVVTK